jgi:hypothetical protein
MDYFAVAGTRFCPDRLGRFQDNNLGARQSQTPGNG